MNDIYSYYQFLFICVHTCFSIHLILGRVLWLFYSVIHHIIYATESLIKPEAYWLETNGYLAIPRNLLITAFTGLALWACCISGCWRFNLRSSCLHGSTLLTESSTESRLFFFSVIILYRVINKFSAIK